MSRDIAGGGDWRRLDPRGNASTPQRAHKRAKPADAIGFKRNLCEGLVTSLTQAETGTSRQRVLQEQGQGQGQIDSDDVCLTTAQVPALKHTC